LSRDDETLALPAAAQAAWQAYRRLLDTKAAHFAALEAGERDARAGVKPRLAHQAHLATLLDAHTAAVSAFKAELQALARHDPTARDALVAALGRVNEGLVPSSGSGAH